MAAKKNRRAPFSSRLTAVLVAVLVAVAGWQVPSHAQEPARGKILDRRGRTLASTRGGSRVYPRGPVAAHAIAAIERELASALAGAPPQDVMLTIDLDLEKVAYGAVARHEAAVAVVEVETGRILALVSTPSFDPAVMTDPARSPERAKLEDDPHSPLVDRTVGRDYPPASTFKLITAVAGLESGAARPEQEVTCSGHRTVGATDLLDMGVHGTIDFVGALQHSCNVYFWSVGERVGVERLAQAARDFGFGAPTGLGIGGDLGGHVPDRAQYSGSSENDRVMRLQTAIGLADVRATVLQVAMAYAALANGGELYQPQIVRRVRDAGGRTIEERAPVLRRHVAASPETLGVIRRGLWRAVNRRGGTAFAAKKGTVKMVGKTGTATLPGSETADSHAWFAGWAPADHPKMAIVVLVENGGIGGAVAAPIARDIIDAYYLHVAREHRAAEAKKEKAAARAKAIARAKATAAKKAKKRAAAAKKTKTKKKKKNKATAAKKSRESKAQAQARSWRSRRRR